MSLRKLRFPRFHREGMWYQWLWEGFVRLGYNRQDHTINQLSSNRIGFDCPMMFEIDGKLIAYDYADFTNLYRPDIKRDLTFKIQCLDDSAIPICQISGKLEYDDLRKELLEYEKEFEYDVIGMFRTTNYQTRLDWIQEVMSMNIRSSLSLYQTPDRPTVPGHIPQDRPRFHDHLRMQYQSKICLAIPGIGYEGGSAWSFRHTEILGMGSFCLMPKTACKYPGNPKDCWVECEIGNLKEVITYYLKNEREREEIAKRGLKYYEEYIKPEAMAKYIMKHI